MDNDCMTKQVQEVFPLGSKDMDPRDWWRVIRTYVEDSKTPDIVRPGMYPVDIND